MSPRAPLLNLFDGQPVEQMTSGSHREGEEAVDGFGSGHSRREFERLVRELTPSLLRTAQLTCWDAAEAEDLVQETWLRVARRWPRVRRMDNPRGYARRILVNLAIDGGVRRSRRRTELVSGESGTSVHDPSAVSALSSVENQLELRRALSLLTPRQRAILVLRYWEDRSEREVAELLGCSANSVKSTASRALAQLRSTMQPIR